MATKAVRVVCYLLFRLLLPCVLLVGAVVRFNALSFLYTIFLLLGPLLQSPTAITIRGGTGLYMKLVFIVGLLAVLAHAVFHITLSAIANHNKPYGHMFPNCSQYEKLARQIALERLDTAPIIDIVRLVAPDVAVFLTGLIVYIICVKLLPAEKKQSEQELPIIVRSQQKRKVNTVVEFIGESVLVLLLVASGVIAPSVLSSVYFLSFLFLATIWALYGHLGRKFRVFRVILLVYSAAHILVLHLYQFQFFQEAIHPDDFIARLVGLTAVVYTDCSKPYTIFFYDDSKWQNFVNPGILLGLYYVLAFEVRHACHAKKAFPVDANDSAFLDAKRQRRRRQTSSERQVDGKLDMSQKEHLVDAEVAANYSSIEPVAEEREGSPTMLSQDEVDAPGSPTGSTKKLAESKRSAWVSMFVYIMRQSYVLSLIAMMVWSILYHSWLTFVLLLAACIIWMFPNSRRVCYMLSPFILFYGIGLLCIQFVFGMDLKNELPTEKNGIRLRDIGLVTYPHPCIPLAIQVAFTLCFWLTLRQYMRERRSSVLAEADKYPLEPVVTPTTPTSPKSLSEMLRQYVWCMLCKYWIFLCATMLLVISLQEVVVYRIIYMILFLMFVITFQYAYRFWRLTMKLFWWVVILYSMVVLIILYTYQFENIAKAWRDVTKLPNETLADIGLEQFNTVGLFVRLLTPTTFLILLIIQVHYFHVPFLAISDLDRYKGMPVEGPTTPTVPTSDTQTTIDEGSLDIKEKKSFGKRFARALKKAWVKVGDVWEVITWFLWRLAEIHVFKIVAFVVIMVCTHEVSAVSAVYVILLAVFLPMTGCWFLFSHISLLWTALVILSKMIYQLNLVDNTPWLTNCTGNISQEAPFNTTINNAEWVGMKRMDSLGLNFGAYIKNYLGILLIIIFERVIVYHQTQLYNKPGVPKPKTGIIFSTIKRAQADEGTNSCLKYFLNYFFYKFGLELCYIVTAITICVRVDAYSMLYAIFLGILLLLNRRNNARVWPVYTVILVILLPVQFLLALGVPLGLCYTYAWDNKHWLLEEDNQVTELEQWLFLPDYEAPPNAYKLVADFFQLLLVCLQWRVFRKELAMRGEMQDGGSNEDILPEVEAKTPIPVKDFTTEVTKKGKVVPSSYLDIIKNFVFVYMFWVTLAIVFIAGTSRINLFSMGYVIAVFYFMWFEREFLIKPLRRLVRAWNLLLGLCYFIILLKAALQLPGCVYIKIIEDKACWLVQLLGLTCLRPGYKVPFVASCTVAEDNTGLSWDVVCFTFLLLQKRIYTSHYFRHVVADFEAQNRLASRGCQLINRILMRQVAKQMEEERLILSKIKLKMQSLKKKQASLKKSFVEPDEHFQAIRSGDYYLFEDSEEEEEEPEDEVTTITYGQGRSEDEDEEAGGPSPLQLITTAVTSGTDEAVKKAEEEGGGSKPSSPRPGAKNQGLDEPGTSRQKVGREAVEEEEEEKGGVLAKLKTICSFILAFLVSCANWLTGLFNRISRNYRLVADKMKDDHIAVKRQIQSEVGHVEMKETEPRSDGEDLMEVSVQPVTTDVAPLKSEISLADIDLDRFDEKQEEERHKSCVYRLLVATYFALVARTEIMCYFLMILNHILSASLLSLPLPMFAFLWGMLSVPRPTKTFWITVITYTEAVVVVKYLFQFGFFTWNDKVPGSDPFWPPKILGIEQKDNFWVMDLILLLVLFLHRTILKRYGLWKDEEEPTIESKSSSTSSIEATKEEIAKMEAIRDEERHDSRTSSLQVQPSILRAPSSSSSIEEGVDEPKAEEKDSAFKAVFRPFINFYKQLTCPDYNATTDVYASMFACDFINFLIVVFGYQAFGPSQSAGGDVTSYISEDRVPVPFLIMLLAQFVLIIIDRALYLRKNVLGKFIFQILLVVLLHIWMFFIIPYWTGKPFTSNKPAALWYFIKCVYFYLSAYQIKSAYPTRILGNFLTKKYNYVNLFLFKGFLAIPFLLELRTLMDWIWTNTTMAIGSWLQMEDIYANIYVLKCQRVIEKNHPTPRAQPKAAVIKYGVGGLLLFVVIFIIWFPLVIFSFANTVYIANPPKECTVSVSIAGYQPLFEIMGQQQNIQQYNEGQYLSLKNDYDKDVSATMFLNNYKPEDISLIQLDGKSTSVWTISPPSFSRLIKDLQNDSTPITMDFIVSFTRAPHDQAGETLNQQYRKSLSKTEKLNTAAMLVGNTSAPVEIANVYPEDIRLGSKQAMAATAILGPSTTSYTNIRILLNSTNGTESNASWWEITVDKNTNNYINFLTFNDRVAPAGFSLITGYGIIGLYVTFILLIGRMLRLSTTGMAATISFRELPNVDNILRLCLDLYLVREMNEWRLEEDMYAKLLFVYRSAETRVKWTRLRNSQIIEMKKNM
ncbi:piezo-type mechanosensitive ion channel component 1-like isoform X1 [Mya arenaria]|uniref:piezo-type mechanosensitive ion channel component 1-like isoform X1 n=1 Tax=Mya arenaria TaxID=6604 RepID=UPI0022E91A64|nr:piezo-type mechanosensitive ion channel component 1-like isoform X1 [Mya arenaria]